MKTIILATAAALAISVAPALAEFPEKDLQGVIQWGAGGSTDVVMRAVTPHAEELLGRSVVMTNRTGGVGAIATKYVYAQRPDGYTLLMGAENPQLYKVMGLGDVDYNSFIPINILARGVPLLVARNDAPYNSLKELAEYAQANPGEVKFGSTGPGGLPSVVTAMLTNEIEMPVTAVPYDGDGPALTALMGGAIDVMPAVLGAAIEHVKAGRMKPLAIIDAEPTPVLPDVPTVVADYPEFAKYLPWGPFFGIFVKEGTPDEAVEKLVAEVRDRFEGSAAIDQAALKEISTGIFERTFAVTIALNALTLSVAGVALFTSLLTLAGLRLAQAAPVWALGLTRRQLARIELARAVALAALTALLALPVGLAVAWVLTAVVNVEAFGWRLPVHLYPGQWLRLLALALATALAAAAWPAWRLGRAHPLDLLRSFSNER